MRGWYNVVVNDNAQYEDLLRKRLRFYLPPIVTVGMMVALASIAADFQRPADRGALVMIAAFEVALVGNLVARQRVKRALDRLMRGRCIKCGYDLRATPDRCPECGTVPTGQKS